MSFWDDVQNFGSGLLEDVGEGFGNLVDVITTPNTSTNAGTTQQPNTPVMDNHGNNLTTPQGGYTPVTTDKTMLYVGGGLAAVVLVVGLVLAVKK